MAAWPTAEADPVTSPTAPTTAQKAALAGTGAPGAGNKFVTNDTLTSEASSRSSADSALDVRADAIEARSPLIATDAAGNLLGDELAVRGVFDPDTGELQGFVAVDKSTGLFWESGSVSPGVFDPGTRTFTGPESTIQPKIDALTAGTEYVWNETDGAGALVDIVTGVAE